MSGEFGLTLDERIRRTLEPLGGPLRIDAFLALVARERAQRAAAVAQRARPSAPRTAPRPRPADPGESGRRAAAAAPPDGAGLSDSQRLRAEVESFLHRDDPADAEHGEVQDFLEFMGGNALAPEVPED